MYLFSKDPLASHEVATVHPLSSLTGGSVNLYSPYLPDMYGTQYVGIARICTILFMDL